MVSDHITQPDDLFCFFIDLVSVMHVWSVMKETLATLNLIHKPLLVPTTVLAAFLPHYRSLMSQATLNVTNSLMSSWLRPKKTKTLMNARGQTCNILTCVHDMYATCLTSPTEPCISLLPQSPCVNNILFMIIFSFLSFDYNMFVSCSSSFVWFPSSCFSH